MANFTGETNKRALTVLRRASRRRLAKRIGPKDPDLVLCTELVDAGYLDGWVTLGIRGEPLCVLDAFITRAGEEYLERFADVENVAIWRTVPRTPRRMFGTVGSMLV